MEYICLESFQTFALQYQLPPILCNPEQECHGTISLAMLENTSGIIDFWLNSELTNGGWPLEPNGLVSAGPTGSKVLLHILLRPFGVVAIQTSRRREHPPMFRRRIAMHAMAR